MDIQVVGGQYVKSRGNAIWSGFVVSRANIRSLPLSWALSTMLVVVLFLVAAAKLACCYRASHSRRRPGAPRQPASATNGSTSELNPSKKQVELQLPPPQHVVLMPGKEMPTFLALPLHG
ncbi:hypothetical protein GOP47_0007328 [Adiantum capillus-veneris]|uniref:Uncharacterized protein n=1 Tax=Adiantum capillus-veneris TaxID=13818 RepID=A0A9D4V0P1_ADICA|nr:hypothetical protein GOP47_0007328 [Adiantum capillus-veneris]